jgi:hypothetical protein
MTVSVPELLAQATSRVQVRRDDGKSGSTFERLEIDGHHYFVKRLSPSTDWVMRVTGDHVHRPYLVWQAGIMDRTPACIDHTVVAMQIDGRGDDAVLTMVMRDVGAYLVPEGDSVIPVDQHRRFIEHMAALAVAFWGFGHPVAGLSTMAERVRYFAPDNIATELEVADVPGPIAAADAGWRGLATGSPLLLRAATAVHSSPELVTAPLASTPITFLHGDWKMGNLGSHTDGRTILLDWAYPGAGPACWDLCWYLALNSARLAEPKEAAIDRYRAELESHGIATEGWWTTQLDLCLIAIMATFGWEKALGDETELRWWERQVADAITRQGLDVS